MTLHCGSEWAAREHAGARDAVELSARVVAAGHALAAAACRSPSPFALPVSAHCGNPGGTCRRRCSSWASSCRTRRRSADFALSCRTLRLHGSTLPQPGYESDIGPSGTGGRTVVLPSPQSAQAMSSTGQSLSFRALGDALVALVTHLRPQRSRSYCTRSCRRRTLARRPWVRAIRVRGAHFDRSAAPVPIPTPLAGDVAVGSRHCC